MRAALHPRAPLGDMSNLVAGIGNRPAAGKEGAKVAASSQFHVSQPY
jgi:hypothetical protein